MLSAQPIRQTPAGARAALQDEVAELLLRFVEQIHSGPAGPWLDLGLTMPQLKALLVLDWLGPVPMSRVAGQLRVGVSAATGLVDRLVEQGLARREADQRDRRVVRVGCTNAGRELLMGLRSAGTERIEHILQHLTLEELARCASAMSAVNAAAGFDVKARSTCGAALEAAAAAEEKGW